MIKAYHRLIDLKEKYVDVEVLGALSSSVRRHLKDANDVSILKYKEKILKLFGRITSLVPTNWQIYWFYADVVLHLAQVDDTNNNLNHVVLSKESADKYFGLLFKAFRNLYNQTNWEMTKDSCVEVIDHTTQVLARKSLFFYLLLIIKFLWSSKVFVILLWF